jgi:hypothetical protein
MKWNRVWKCLNDKRLMTIAVVMIVGVLVVSAQSPELQKKVAEVKQEMTEKNHASAEYTWL